MLDQPRVTNWSGVTLPGTESYDGVWLRLTVTDPRVCRINVHSDVPADVADPIPRFRSPVLVDGNSLAYLTNRRQRHRDTARWELGAIGHGPGASRLVERLCDEVRTWAPERNDRTPTLLVYPAGTADAELPSGTIFDKNNSRFVITYDDATEEIGSH